MSSQDLEVQLPGGERRCRICIEAGALHRLGELVSSCISPSRLLVVSDSRVHSLYGELCRRSLEAQGWKVFQAVIPPGERSKSLAGVRRLYNAAVAAGLDRHDPILALGGGVVGDLAGFAAATYLRGVPLVMVPTTLLAQVDSSIGGKVGVNHPRGKNLIGAFYQPRLVVLDPELTASLPRRQFRAGLAETAKYGIVLDAELFALLERRLEALPRERGELLAGVIERAVRAKVRVVEQDEREAGYRRVLNFGHTIGHALEAAAGYRHYLHGEAVLVGMIAATGLARRLGLLEAQEADRIEALLNRIGIKAPPPGLTTGEVLSALAYDKKRRGEELALVLPTGIGRFTFYFTAERELLEEAVSAYLRQGRLPGEDNKI
ncbi:MAG: 3-dehydroquinate synthase [Dethiobacteria bacterium]|jgi:3-dehydroquinate synthase|nr:3-dehydroquinate synthase [Bacillota bacterium]